LLKEMLRYGFPVMIAGLAFVINESFYIPKKEFWSAMEIVPYVILANLLLGIYTNLSVWYKLQDKTKIGAYISVGGAVVTVVFNFILIPYMGILGSAITTLIAYLFMMIVSYVMGQKAYPIPYDKKSIALYLGGATCLSYVYFYNFRENYIIGGLFILLFVGVIAYKEQKLIQRILR